MCPGITKPFSFGVPSGINANIKSTKKAEQFAHELALFFIVLKMFSIELEANIVV